MADWITKARDFYAWGKCDYYLNSAQTVNNQTVTVRSIPVPSSCIASISITTTVTNSTQDKGGRIDCNGTVMRGTGNIFKPADFDQSSIKNLGNCSVDVAANVTTQSADIQVSGTTNGAGVINWTIWTIVRWSI